MQKEITIYTWDHCPYCRKALGLLEAKKLQYKQIKLDGDEAARGEMSKHTKGNRKSVPQRRLMVYICFTTLQVPALTAGQQYHRQ